MTRVLLSLGFGAPVVLSAMSLLFAVEWFRLNGRRPPVFLRPAAAVVTIAVVSLVVARFVHYA